MTDYEYFDPNGDVLQIDKRSAYLGHIRVIAKIDDRRYWVDVKAEDAPAVAIAILEAAGIKPSLTASLDCPAHYERRALAHMETAQKLRERKASEQVEQDAKVDAYRRAKVELAADWTEWKYLTEGQRDLWRTDYHKARKFFAESPA